MGYRKLAHRVNRYPSDGCFINGVDPITRYSSRPNSHARSVRGFRDRMERLWPRKYPLQKSRFQNSPYQSRYSSNRRSPVRWIFSHALPYWPIWVTASGGAFINAALAGIYPVLVGQAFNVILVPQPDIQQLINIAILVAVTQVARGFLQFARNFGFELLAQKVERDVRDELYTSLLGKSMTFHNLQPVGDTMARATNDVREVNFLFSPGLNMVIGSLAFLIMPLFIAPRYHPGLMIAPAVFIIVYYLCPAPYLRRLQPITDEVRGPLAR